VFAMARIANMYGIDKINSFISTYENLLGKKKRVIEY